MFRRPSHRCKCFKTGIIKNAFRWGRLHFVRRRPAMNPLRKTWWRYDEYGSGACKRFTPRLWREIGCKARPTEVSTTAGICLYMIETPQVTMIRLV